MSFIDSYLNKNRLDGLSDSVKNTLGKVEANLTQQAMVAGASGFDECLKQHGPEIADLVERVSTQVGTVSVKSIADAFNLLRFVKNISFEIAQIVEQLSTCSIPKDVSDEELKNARIVFGVELTQFVWATVGPLNDKFNWIPFKKRIETKLVRWIAKMGIQFSMDFFEKNVASVVSGKKSVKKSTVQIMKVL